MIEQKLIFESNLKLGLKELHLENKSVVLITGKSSYLRFEKIIKSDIQIREHIQITDSNPDDVTLTELAQSCGIRMTDNVLVFGGGSVIDAAKIISFMVANNFELGNELNSSQHYKSPRLHIVPTTCGTGSESNCFANYYKDKKRVLLSHPCLMPNQVLLNEEPLKKLPKLVFASSLVNAIGQSLESTWSLNATEASQALSIGALKYLLSAINAKSLKDAVLGANTAGRSTQLTGLGVADAISHSLTANFGISYGEGMSLIIPPLLVYNFKGQGECRHPQGKEYIDKVLGKISESFEVNNGVEASIYLREFFKSLGLREKLSDYGIKRKDISTILESGYIEDQYKNNPFEIGKAEVESMLLSIV